jgi:RNA polymerase sigma-B factor
VAVPGEEGFLAAPAYVQIDRGRLKGTVASYALTHDPALRGELLSAYQGLAYSLAARCSRRGEELDDLKQIALIGLLHAIERFDPTRGTELTTFATATIQGELKRHLRDRGWSVRVPRRVHDLFLRAQHAIDDLTQEQGRSPTVFEVAQRVGVSLEDVLEALEAGGLRQSSSLEDAGAVDEDRGALLGAGDDGLANVDHRLALLPLISQLPERQQQILRLRFVSGCSQSEIASRVGVSQMQVSRLLSRSLSQLRSWAAEQ